MKLLLTYLSLSFVLLWNSACQNQTAFSQQSENTHQNNKNEISNIETQTQTPEIDGDEFDIDTLVSEKKALNYKGYIIRQFLTEKKYDEDSPIAEIADAVLEKNGKPILKFEGVYYPLGNQMQFGLFSLLKNNNKELLVYDSSQRYGRLWVVSFEKEAKLIFDSEDWGGFREWVNFYDLDNDGVYEFTMAQYNFAGFTSFSHIETPLMSIIFKYDNKVGKYVPANHKFQVRAKNIVNESTTRIDQSGEKLGFREVLENFLELTYAGMEEEAWEYFEKNYVFGEDHSYSSNSNPANEITLHPPEAKGKARERIEKSLKKNKVYQFIKNDLEKNE